jgi:hypothetical protein
VDGGPLSGLEPLSFADPSSYDPRFPDVLDGESGGAVALVYGGAPGMGAAVAWGVGADGERGVLLGFPFETVAGAVPRVELMGAIMQLFEVEEVPAPEDPDTGGVDDTAGSSGGPADDAGSDGPSGSETETGSTGSAGAAGGEDGCACRVRSGSLPTAWWAVGLLALARGRGRRRATTRPSGSRGP